MTDWRYCCVVLCCVVLRCVALRCVVLHCIVLLCIALCCFALHCYPLLCITLLCIAMHCVVLCCAMLCCVVLCCITLHYIALRCIALYYIALHYITLQYTTLHYITLHYIILYYILIWYTTVGHMCVVNVGFSVRLSISFKLNRVTPRVNKVHFFSFPFVYTWYMACHSSWLCISVVTTCLYFVKLIPSQSKLQLIHILVMYCNVTSANNIRLPWGCGILAPRKTHLPFNKNGINLKKSNTTHIG